MKLYSEYLYPLRFFKNTIHIIQIIPFVFAEDLEGTSTSFYSSGSYFIQKRSTFEYWEMSWKIL